MYKIKHYGWRPPLKDQNTRKFMLPLHSVGDLPPMVDLRDQMPPVWDQGNLGGCTSHGVSAILGFLELKQKKPNPYTPDRLGIYYNTRALEGTIASDSGASVADAVKSIAKWGFCSENYDWSTVYNIERFDKAPSHAAYGAMWHNRITQYESINQDLNSLKSILASGNVFTFGFTVYESFESNVVATTGVMPMPQPNEQVLGGHCVTACGFLDSEQRFIVRNSWGSGWGLKGNFTMPYQFMASNMYCDDFWTIKSIP